MPTSRDLQIERFREATADLDDTLVRHLANSAGTLRYPSASFDAVRCGIALYGISPFGSDPALDGLEPALRWESYVALAKRLEPGDSTGYGRRYVADEPTWIGVVPVGYADGFRRDLTGTEVSSTVSGGASWERSRWTRSRSSSTRRSPPALRSRWWATGS